MTERTKKMVFGFITLCSVYDGALLDWYRAEAAPEVLVTVGEETITRADLDARTAMLPPQIRSRFETQAGRQQLLDQVVLISLLSQEARSLGIDKQDEVAKKIKEMTDNIIVQELTRQQVSSDIRISDEEIAAYYQENKKDFVRAEQINASVIMFAAADGIAPDGKGKKAEPGPRNAEAIEKRR